MTEYHILPRQSALHELGRRVPYHWDLNLYRGCEHGCRYCYAMYSHRYLDTEDYFGHIYAKTDILEALERELSSPSWKREVVNIGGVTDSYQPAEAHYRLMPEVLRLLIRYKTPAIISTKSELVLRDYDLIDQLSRITYVNVAATVTTMDESVRSLLEPGAAPSLRRFEMLAQFRKTNASTGLHVMPIIPYLTDSYENIDALFAAARESRVHYCLPGTLYLRGQTRKVFFRFIDQHYPHLSAPLHDLYKTGGAPKGYKDALYQMVGERRAHYGLTGSYAKPMKEKMAQALKENAQVAFDLGAQN